MLQKINASSMGRKAFVFFTGFLLMFFISRLSAAEVLLGLTSLYAVYARFKEGKWPAKSFENSLVRRVLIAIAISLIGYILSDLYYGSEFADLAAGWGRWIFLGINFVGLSCLLGMRWSNLHLIVLGEAIGGVVALYTVSDEPGDWWKFGFAVPVTFGVLTLTDKRPRVLAGLALLILGTVHIFLAFRSLGTACFIGGALVFVPKIGKRFRKAAVVGAMVIVVPVLIYIFSAAGFNEDEARSKGSNENRSDMLVVGWNAFVDHPFLGNGSRLVKTGVMERYFAERTLRSKDKRVLTEEDETEKSLHTQILSALAEGGLLGGAFFFIYGLILLRALQIAVFNEFSHRPIVLVFLILGCFDFWMSPFSTTARFEIALYCSTAVTLIVAVRQGDLGVAAPFLRLIRLIRGVRKEVAQA